MLCPYCFSDGTIVKDSRSCDNGHTVRRRRQCLNCNARFTTFERVQLKELIITKKDRSKRPFDRDKIIRSINLAVRKRPVTGEQVDHLVNGIVRNLESLGKSEVSSELIGRKVMEGLANLDQVAYVRFASVYTDFNEAKDFGKFIFDMENSDA